MAKAVPDDFARSPNFDSGAMLQIRLMFAERSQEYSRERIKKVVFRLMLAWEALYCGKRIFAR
ncbi:MAG: hypothetical protein LBB21_03040 [Holosporaceae bacterium]|jgi:hypothetical protein|nr:hypothetical protein [Holosporaceae bacterium]